MSEKITLSVIKADVGGYVGHSSIHPNLMDVAREKLSRAREAGTLIDFHVTSVGDDLELIMTHRKGGDSEEIHKLAWDTFVAATGEAKRLKLYGAGQDLLSDALSCPEELYDLLMFIGAKGRFLVRKVFRKDGEISAAASTQKLSLIAGRYVGKDDPVLIVRCQSGLPAVGEVLEPFTFPHAVEGWMRGSHRGPLMPVPFRDANPSRFDGPPRVIAAGFQIADGHLIGPRDLFDDPAFDRARKIANEIADYLRAHGPFEPHRLGLDELEYTTMPEIMKKLEDRFKRE